VEQLELERESFAMWFESKFPDWAVLVGELGEAGHTAEQVESVLVRLCYRNGIHPLFVVCARAWMHKRFGVAYVAPVRFN